MQFYCASIGKQLSRDKLLKSMLNLARSGTYLQAVMGIHDCVV